ncbi:FGGY-family carbohydrate kinase [Mesorhizobium sp. L-8-3]|uniref:FGGY-family carbohydrate kinase n=1 Tax=Mesorhizobium sp. L-8-3 TaxID=2744522 RepID=UPI0019264CF8|nr:FGGY-family carbohydrate kinase [Mesorhizobium sp. L-8-3]BCH26339.1 carbohydrate kinase [Mesorhizobium sp. L-8-3]
MTRYVAVIDIGKTNAKVALVDLELTREMAVRTRPNTVLPGAPYPHFDTDALWDFILESLSVLNRGYQVDAISVTTHGATAALLDARGDLALPVLDYEHSGPDAAAAAYAAVRPPFEETGSPRLPGGLNLGAQIFWLSKTFPDELAHVASIVTYPQYWTWRLSGVLAGEVTSLGCHTDLWNPAARDYSSLVDGHGWRALMPPIRPARDRLGPLLPDIARKTGVAAGTSIFCGIHDSNASLLPHLLSRSQPFAVVSSGTWVVSMAMGGNKVTLDAARDTLINVDASGDPVPSARFMGGREFEVLMTGHSAHWTDADVERVLAQGTMLLPAVLQGSGPFPDRQSKWLPVEPPTPAERAVAASFYLALMTATCLDLIGAAGPTIVEGPLAANRLFVGMLAAATGRPVLASAMTTTGTTIGAALLASATGHDAGPMVTFDPAGLEQWERCAAAWRNELRR